jgi:outer membrane protein
MNKSTLSMKRCRFGAASAAIVLAMAIARGASAQTQGSGKASALTQNVSGIAAPSPSISATVSPGAGRQYDSSAILSLPTMFARQWIPGNTEFTRDYFTRMQDDRVQRLTLKEMVFLALKNNPGLGAVSLDQVGASESVRGANAVFDPQMSSQIDMQKQVNTVSSPFQNPGSVALTTKEYDWNFGLSKVLSATNGTFGLTFNNDRELTNTVFSPVNPAYTPTIVMSLSQPLLQNFGWRFATMNVQIAESAQRSAQWNYGSALNDFVQRIGNDYWGVVQAEENLKVQQTALAFNNDLVRVNRASVRVGMMAKVNLTEALSAAATALANVQAAEAALDIAKTTLRQDVAYNPDDSLIAQDLQPAQGPDIRPTDDGNNEIAFRKMLENSPALAGMREAIRSALLQVKYAENQTLPQLNFGAQFGVTSEGGNSKCTATITVPSYANCFDPAGPKVSAGADNAAELPFTGGYGASMNRLFNFSFYDYALVLGFSMPLDNAAPRAALAQARISLDETKLQYRQALYQAALQVKAALANLLAFQQQVESTGDATEYAAESLHDVSVEFKEGTATTNQLLQYQSNLVTAQGNQVQAQVGLENGRLALWHAEGTLLEHFNINFELTNPHQSPWYSLF